MRALITSLDKGTNKESSTELEQKSDIEEQKSVRCKNCGHDITNPKLAIEPHEHTFRNPAGYSFHIVCYSDAPGAADTGEPTTEHTWFPDYAWSYAICLQCFTHVGWWFTGKDRFAGLIASRLIR